MALLTATGVSKSFGGVVALNRVNMHCRSGRITGLLGTNGSGKSTISKIITGVYARDEGSILFKDREIAFKNPREAKANGIAMVFQNLSLIPDLSVWQNIVLGMEETGRLFLDNEAGVCTAREIVAGLLPGLDVHKRVHELHPGEMQIVEIAKAIAARPELLILDEPTAALETAEVTCLFRYMRELAEQGVAMIFTSHRLGEVMEICDDIVVFRNGENVGELDFDVDEKDPDTVIRMIVGDAENLQVTRECQVHTGQPVMEVRGLQYGKYLRDVGFHLHRGEVLGIGGLAGQGQDELMLALAGFYPQARGKAAVDGKKLSLTRPSSAVRGGVLLVPGDRQQEGTFQQKSIYFNMIYPKLGLRRQPFFTPKRRYRREAEEICQALSVRARDIDAPLMTLSGGNQQKIVVGKWLPFDVKVLLLADPAKGVDIRAKKDLYDFILKLVQDKDMSVILYASDSDELISYCDRLLIMYEGRVVSELCGPDITEDRIVEHSMKAGAEV